LVGLVELLNLAVNTVVAVLLPEDVPRRQDLLERLA
jgi:hypothetical protein